MSLSTSGAVPAWSNTTATPQNVTHNYENMVAQYGSQQINGPVYGNVHYGDTKSQDQLIRDRILDSLHFDGMDRYHDRPLKSFPGTYEWIFAGESVPVHACNDCRPDRRWFPRACKELIESDERARLSAIDFGNWLRHSDKIFWVSGKAGSGKSCLMKFLADHPRTYELLCEWAETDVTICRFFFWAAGGELERSRKGLLRGLLHQLLSHDREIIEHVLPQRWTATSRSMQHSPPWEEHELRDALTRAVERAHESAKLCLFVDGLDEFTGDYQDLIDDLDALNGSPAVKICVSSRPWNVFRRRYGAGSEALLLKLHELTYRDLQLFVEERLRPIGATSFSGDTHGKDLRILIMEKAQGVFLWVKLAVNEARRGIGEGDSSLELHRRLEATPKDVNKFIEKIFGSVDPVYEKYCARVLLLLLADLRKFPYSDLPLNRLWCLFEDANDCSSALQMPGKQMGLLEMKGRLDQSESLANKWCKGLVDVVRAPNDQATTYDPSWHDGVQLSFTIGLVGADACKVFDADWTPDHIAFAHRTIFDFARAKANDGTLWRLAGADFSPVVSEILAMVRLTKLIPLPEQAVSTYHKDVLPYLLNVLPRDGEKGHRTVHCDRRAIDMAARGFIEISRMMQQHYANSGSPGNWVESALDQCPDWWLHVDLRKDASACDVILLAEILREGLADLFWAILAHKRHLNTRSARHCWIEAAFNLGRRNGFPLRSTIVRLLEAEVDLNELNVYGDGSLQSTWQRILISIHSETDHWAREPSTIGPNEYFPVVLDLLDILLTKGADPGCSLPVEEFSDEHYLTPCSTVPLAIESFELGMAYLNERPSYEGNTVLKQNLTTIIQKLRGAMNARAEASGRLSGSPAETALNPQRSGVAVSGCIRELEQSSDDETSLAMIPHKRRRLDISDILN